MKNKQLDIHMDLSFYMKPLEAWEHLRLGSGLGLDLRVGGDGNVRVRVNSWVLTCESGLTHGS